MAIEWHDLDLPRVRFGVRTYKSGRHAYVIHYYDPSKSQRKKLETLPQGTHSKAFAEAVRRATQWHQGLYDPWEERPDDMSLAAAVKAWFAFGEKKGWSAATVRGRKGVLDLLLDDYARRDVEQITPDQVDTFINSPTLKSAASRRSYLRVLHTFFRWCRETGYREDVPTEHVEKPKKRRKRVGNRSLPIFTPETLKQFCAAARDYYDRKRRQHSMETGAFIWIVDIVRFAVATGLRKGEIRYLRWADVDLKEGKMLVRGYEDTWRGAPVAFEPKCASERVLPLYPMAREVLRRRQEMRRSENPSEPVFLGSRGGRLGNSQINRAFRTARDEAGVSTALDVHACRHTFASWLLSAGVPIYRVSKLLGHRKVALTVDTYGHLVPQPADAGEEVFST